MYLENEAEEVGRQRQPMFTHKLKPGECRTGLRKNQG